MRVSARVPLLKDPRQEKFCRAYLLGATIGNATASFKVSHPGCKDTTARNEGAKLLAKPCIEKRIRQLQADAASVAEIDGLFCQRRLREEADHATRAKDRIKALIILATMRGELVPKYHRNRPSNADSLS